MESRIEELTRRARFGGWCGLGLGVVSVLLLGAFGVERAHEASVATGDLPTPRVQRDEDTLGTGALAQVDAAPAWTLPAGQLDPALASAEGGVLQQELGDGTIVSYTLDAQLQNAATRSLQNYKVEQGAVVAVDPRTGEVLVYAEHTEGLNGRSHFPIVAEGPAASLFKLITAASLIEKGGLTPESTICTHGGLRKLTRAHLRSNPRRDTRCDTLSRAFGASRNVAFARWADQLLEPSDLTEMAERFQFNHKIPFLWTPGTSEALFDGGDRLDHARVAAGFQGTTISPLHASLLVAAVANGGTMMAPRIVDSAIRDGEVLYQAEHAPLAQVVSPETAGELTTVMLETTRSGTARKFFAQRRRMEGIPIAAKTGHLAATIHGRPVHYSWFMAFAPADRPEIAVAAVVVLGEQWTVKGVVPARDVLEAWARVQVAGANQGL